MPKPHVIDAWVCEGRLCSAHGSDAVKDACAAAGDDRVRVLRGGCFGLCDFGPNVVVRRYASEGRRPEPDADRLSLTRRPNETVYSGVEIERVEEILRSHLDEDTPLVELTYESRDADRNTDNQTSSGIRKLRRA